MNAPNSGNLGKVVENIGKLTRKINVELSTRFLEHFSEQLYSSPQKAFEELISNGWDAGADFVDIRISSDLSKHSATMCVLDNGASMDEDGLKELWHIAFSPKRENPIKFGRSVIGKFGIGKLATYVLASKLTYICKSEDGKIRRITMDYGDIDRQKDARAERLISDLVLDIYEVELEDVKLALAQVDDGEEIFRLIQTGAVDDKADDDSEFGGDKTSLSRLSKGTWTLVVLSDLKPTGMELRVHVLKRMLRAALPFGSEMVIRINGEKLTSSKITAAVAKEWTIGPELGFDFIELDSSKKSSLPNTNQNEGSLSIESTEKERIEITSSNEPYPHVNIPGIGRVTGLIRLFDEKISGGKSDERGASNGFHVNVLGRVVNQSDPAFGEDNLSHAAWARFRMAVRADGLNPLLTTSREQIKEKRETKIFRAFLRKAFNTARNFYDSDMNLEMPDGGDVLVKSLGVISLSPLRNVVSDVLETQASIPGLFDEEGIDDRKKQRQQWRAATGENIKSALSRVNYERASDNSFAKFRLKDSTIVVNKDHPFVIEHSGSKAEKELIRTVAMVTLLSDIYALDIGVERNC